MSETVRLTVGQAVIRFLGQQYSERDGVERRLVTGMFGIFGHGNVCGVGQALLQDQSAYEDAVAAGTYAADADPLEHGHLPYYLIRNEQSGVHAATAYARSLERLAVMAVTTSIGPGATNMVTGAALATTNRIPVLLFPSDQFVSRAPDPVLQQLESPQTLDTAVTDCFRPASRFFDRIVRPEQLIPSLMNAMRVLTDPADTGAVTIALPQDVQAEAYDWPVRFFDRRVWPTNAGAGCSGACCRDHSGSAASADRCRWWSGLLGRLGRPASLRGRHRHTGGRHPRGQGGHQLGSPQCRRRYWLDGLGGRECACERS